MPRIGLLSDSHGDHVITRRAVSLLVAKGVDMLLHMGDVCGTAVLDELVVAAPNTSGNRNVPDTLDARVVFGNNDDPDELGPYARSIGLRVDHPAGRVSLGNDTFLAYMHGDRNADMSRAVADGARYLVHGHTHLVADSRVGKTRVLNPGAIHRASRYTVAVLDTAADRFVVHEVTRGD